MRSFGSDNHSGIHPKILEALIQANADHAKGYGDDPWTHRLQARFKEVFGERAEAHPVFNGTGANVLSMALLTKPFHAILCAQSAHLQNDETGAPERFTGCKLILVPTTDGKIRPDQLGAHLSLQGDMHRTQPKVVSISQCTEYGTLYSVQEIRELAVFARRHGMYLHVDGSRISNAAAALGVTLKEMITDTGVDVLSFGGTKNGLMVGEAVVILDPALAPDFRFIRKQGLQLASKMRFISAQLLAYLENDHWKQTASHANAMARLIAERAGAIAGVRITQKVETNAVFASIPKTVTPLLQKEFPFYVWKETEGESHHEVRWMTSFDTTEKDITAFCSRLKSLLSQ